MRRFGSSVEVVGGLGKGVCAGGAVAAVMRTTLLSGSEVRN
jgi:hypothetical protein